MERRLAKKKNGSVEIFKMRLNFWILFALYIQIWLKNSSYY